MRGPHLAAPVRRSYRMEADPLVRRTRAGFTLVELMIVVAIVGILTAVAIPKFAATKEKACLAAMRSDLRNLLTTREGYFADFQTYVGGTATNRGTTPRMEVLSTRFRSAAAFDGHNCRDLRSGR